MVSDELVRPLVIGVPDPIAASGLAVRTCSRRLEMAMPLMCERDPQDGAFDDMFNQMRRCVRKVIE